LSRSRSSRRRALAAFPPRRSSDLERRADNHETNETVAAKLRAAVEAELTPIVCVGESLQQRQDRTHIDFTLGQLCLDGGPQLRRSEEHTSELQSRFDLVCRRLLEK